MIGSDYVNNRTCSIENCASKVHGWGWCSKHYNRWRRNGDPLKTSMYVDPEEKFAHSTKRQGECLAWTAHKDRSGYGLMKIDSTVIMAHRYAWERINGGIPDGLEIDHVCHNRDCVELSHLRLANRSENCSNRSSGSTKSSSGVRNVYPYKLGRGGWQVRLKKKQKYHYFGIFESIEEAAAVAEKARQDLFGEFAGRG